MMCNCDYCGWPIMGAVVGMMGMALHTLCADRLEAECKENESENV